MSDLRFLRQYRLQSGADFRRVYARKRSVSDGVLIVYALANDLTYSRLGLSVSRKVGQATVRNRWKRLIREAFRLQRLELPVGFDFVVIPRPLVVPSLDAVAQSLRTLTHRATQRPARERGSRQERVD